MPNSLPPEQKSRVRRRLNFDDVEPINPVAETSEISVGVRAIDIPDDNSGTSKDEPKVLSNQVPLDQDINIIDLSNMTQSEKFKQMEKWNFDFDNEVPLDGNWEWERAQPPRSVEHKEKVCAMAKEENEDRNV